MHLLPTSQGRTEEVTAALAEAQAAVTQASLERREAERLTRSLTEQLATIRRLVLAEAGGVAQPAPRRSGAAGGRKRSRVRESILALADSPKWAESALYLPSPDTPPLRT